MLQIRKVIEHIYEKWLNPESGSAPAGYEHTKSELDADDLMATALEMVEVYCNDQVCHTPTVSQNPVTRRCEHCFRDNKS